METSSLRAELRHGTADIHQRLDAAVGHFVDRASYRTYLENTFRFRQLVEPAVADNPDWSALSLLPELRQDLRDVGVETTSPSQAPISLSDPSAQIGALYVLEGSGLGARLLFRRAEALGLSEQFGARHLARQTSDPERWRRFLALLDHVEIDRSRALTAANHVFETAFALYAEQISERS